MHGRGPLLGWRVKLATVADPVTELATFFASKTTVPDEDLVRLTSAARAAGHRWAAIAAACGITTSQDTYGVITQPGGASATTPAEFLFLGIQHATENLTGSRRYPPLTWPCPTCRRQVTDRAPVGRPTHVEHGHGADCARLARDQAADLADRRARLPALIEDSEPARVALQRHQLSTAIIDDCPRCGWHGYFHTHLATIDGDWGTAVCDNCCADLAPYITVTVAFFSARLPDSRQPSIVIRQRTRSDHRYTDIGEEMTWRLSWEHTTLLTEDTRGDGIHHIAEISRGRAEQIMADIASHYWPPDAAQLPWVANGYPD